MKKNRISALLFGAALMGLVACGTSNSSDKTTEESKTEQNAGGVQSEKVWDGKASFQGISLGTKLSEVEKILGKPEELSDTSRNNFGDIIRTATYKKKGIEISFNGQSLDDLAASMITMNESCSLKNEKGVGVGSTREEVLKAYATDFGEAGDGYITISNGRDICNGKPNYFYTLKDGKVSQINLSYLMD